MTRRRSPRHSPLTQALAFALLVVAGFLFARYGAGWVG